jgi:hypothetical protein
MAVFLVFGFSYNKNKTCCISPPKLTLQPFPSYSSHTFLLYARIYFLIFFLAVCVGVFVVGIFVAFAVVVIARGSTGYAVTVQLEERHQAPQFDSTGVELEYATGYAQQHTGAVYSSDDSNADADNRRLM